MRISTVLCTLLTIVVLSACRKKSNQPDPIVVQQPIILSIDSLKTLATNIPKADYNDLVFINPTTGFAVTTGLIIKTTDGGATWTTTPSPNGIALKRIQFTDSQTGYIVGGVANAGIILKTTNSGQDWTIISYGTIEALNGMYFVSNTTGYIVGDNVFSKTTDGGQTWASIKEASASGFNDIRFKNAQVGIATASKGMYFKTIDGGNTWQKVQVATANNLSNVYFTPTASFIKKSVDTLINVDANMAVTKINPAIYKMLFVDDKRSIGIGNHFEQNGFWPYGDIFVTNDAWLSSGRKTYDQNAVFNFTAIANMTDHKIMILGTGFNGTKVMILNR